VLKKSFLANGIEIRKDIEGEENLEASVYNGCQPGDEIRPYVFIGRVATDTTSFPLDDSSLRFPL
jgi:hypothetical protein